MLIDELRKLAERPDAGYCVAGAWIASQDPELQQVIDLLKVRVNLNYSEMLDLLKQHEPDLPFKRTSFILHMKGTCNCPKA